MELNPETQTMLANQILNYEEQIFNNVINIQNLPSVIYKPRLYVDGDKWCAGYGDMPNGVFGFGDSPQLAMDNFNESFNKKLNKSAKD